MLCYYFSRIVIYLTLPSRLFTMALKIRARRPPHDALEFAFSYDLGLFTWQLFDTEVSWARTESSDSPYWIRQHSSRALHDSRRRHRGVSWSATPGGISAISQCAA